MCWCVFYGLDRFGASASAHCGWPNIQFIAQFVAHRRFLPMSRLDDCSGRRPESYEPLDTTLDRAGDLVRLHRPELLAQRAICAEPARSPPFGKSGMWKHRVSAFRHGRLFFAVLRSRGRRRGASSTSVGTGSSFFRLRVTRATACLGDRIDSFRFFWRHLRSDNRVRGSRSAVLPRCSIFSRCSRVDRSTLDWF